MNGFNLKNVKLNKIWIHIQDGEKIRAKTTDFQPCWFFFRSQIRKDTNTHTQSFKEGWRSKEPGLPSGAPHRTPHSHTLSIYRSQLRFWSSVPKSECHHQTQKYDSEDIFTIAFLLLEAHPDKMKCKEHSRSSPSKYRHRFASAGPKSHFLPYPLPMKGSMQSSYIPKLSLADLVWNPRSTHHLLA